MKVLVTFLLSVACLLLQLFVAPNIEIWGAKPDFIMILIVCSALLAGEAFSPMLIGLYLGIAVDATTQGSTFVNSGIYFVLAAMLALAKMIVENKNLASVLIATAASMLLKYLALIFVLYALKIQSRPSFMVFIAGLPTVLYTTLACVAVYYLLNPIYKYRFMQPEKQNTSIFIGG